MAMTTKQASAKIAELLKTRIARKSTITRKNLKMTKQEASAKLAELLEASRQNIRDAVKLADEHGLYFDVNVGGVTNAYVSKKFDKEYENMSDAERDNLDFYYEGYDGWQSSSC